MATRKAPGELQHRILAILWDRDEATVATVHEALLPDRKLAHTTVATMLRKMEARGLVAHRTDGRQFVYRAVRGRQDVHREMVSEVVDRAFAGDASALVSHLLQEGEFDPTELSALRDLIANHIDGGPEYQQSEHEETEKHDG